MEEVRNFFKNPYNVVTVLFIYFIVLAFLIDTPEEIYNGFYNLVFSPDILLTDYLEVGGLGATLFNIGLSGIFVVYFLRNKKMKANGSIIMALWLVTGFSFFGKNVLNMIPIIIGGYLFSVFVKEAFLKYALVTLLSTSLSPVVSQTAIIMPFSNTINILIGIMVGILVGFIMAPIASNTLKAHSGFNLYNVGFAAGIVGLVIMGIFHGVGLSFELESQISTDYTLELALLVISICVYLIVIGLLLGNDNKTHMKKIYKSTGRLVSDFYLLHKETVYINMGVSGLFALIVILILGRQLNGPIVGGIFTIIGFGCFGKHLKNMYPVMIGCLLCIAVTVYEVDNTSMLIAILFSTCLAPIAGTFGLVDGILAGFLHIFVVANVASIHGGLNLYNNGFAAGFVAMVLVPVITTLRKGDFN